MNFKYTTIIVMILAMLALSRGIIVHVQDISFAPLTALAEGDGGGGGGGGDGGGGGGHDCTEVPTSDLCSNVAGQYGIPATDTVGMASLLTNSCTGAVTYVGGCSAPPPPPPLPPTATLTVNNVSSVTVPVGANLVYVWDSTNGTSWSSTWSSSGGSCGTSGVWDAHTAQGGYTWPADISQAGCTYLITYNVSGPGGNASDSITVTITNPAPPAPTCALTATATPINAGDSSTLLWISSNATSLTIDQGIGAVTPVASGSKLIPSIGVTTTYTATVTGPGGTATCATTVIVSPPPLPLAKCTLSLDKTAIQAGGSAVLSWATNRTDSGHVSLTIDHGIGAVAITGGSRTIAPTVTTTYTGTIFDNNGGFSPTYTDYCSVTITVTPTPPPPPPPPAKPTCTLSASPTSIQQGSSSTLSWTTTNSSSFSINQGIGSVTPVAAGSKSVSPTVTTTYTGTATGTGGSATCTATVTVTVPPPPPPKPTCTLVASPTVIQTGSSSTLSWTTTNASAFSIDHSIGSVTPVAAGSKSVSPAVTTTYTGTATGTGGTVTCAATVTVIPTPPPALGCISVLKETFDPSGNKITPVAQFTFTLDGGTTVQNDASGNAQFVGVTPGLHQVVETSPGETWKLLSVTPTDGKVTVHSGTVCDGVVFKNQQVLPPPPPPPPAKPTCTLAASPSSIQQGSLSTLSWTTTNASAFSIDQGIGSVTPVSAGTKSVSPTVTTTYTGTVTGTGGSATCTATVTVSTTPPPPPKPTCTLTANPTAIQTNASSTLSWTATNATSFSINQGIGAVTPVSSGSKSVSPAETTTYTGTVTGEGGTATCTATVTVSATPPPPSCSLVISPTSYVTGGSATLSWSGTRVSSVSIDNGVGATTTIPGSIVVSPTAVQTYTYTGTFTTTGGGTITCSTDLTVTAPPPSGCTSNCGGGGGGGGIPSPHVTLLAHPNVGQVLGAYLYLSQIPYTGLDLGPLGTALYWAALIGWALALAYLVLFGAAPVLNRTVRTFASRVHATLNTQTPAPVAVPVQAAPVLEMATATPRTYSHYDGFKSFAQKEGVLSIDDIVKGLSRQHSAPADAPHANVEPIYEKVEPIYENVDPILDEAAPETKPNTTVPASADTRGFVAALVEGDREAVFAGLRQHVRGGGSPEKLISPVVCLLDDAYRARVDGTTCDADVMRLTARLSTPTLEKLVASLTTAIDSSYTADVTGAKLALTRALATLGA